MGALASRPMGHGARGRSSPAPTPLVSASDKFARHLGKAEKSGLQPLGCCFLAV